MNILMIASLYKPYNRGGAEVVFENLVNELKKEHNVSILTIAPWSGFRSLQPSMAQENGATIYRFYPFNIFSFIHIIGKPALLRLIWHVLDMFNLHSYFVMRSVIRHVKPDVVMTHNIKGVGYTVPRAIRSTGIPHVHTLQDIQLLNPSGLVLYGEERAFKNTNILVRLYERACRRLFGSPSMVVFASDYLRNLYREKGFFFQSSIITIPNPLPPVFFDAPVSIKEKSTPVIFAAIGQIDIARGSFFCVEAFKKFSRPDCELWMIGGGEEKIRSFVDGDPRIHLLGAMPNEKIGELLQNVHYVLVPVLCYTNSPVVTFEAFARGVPAIVASIGGAAEPVKEGENGFLF
ncbi:MAG: glycosyltransferase, partial [Patescibacteria group bacterium]